MYRVVWVKASTSQAYTLELEFMDGTKGIVDLSSRLFGPVFEPLRDPAFFSQVGVDEYGAPFWPNGADLAPDAIYRDLTSEVRRTDREIPA